jgi:hypothetical protein
MKDGKSCVHSVSFRLRTGAGRVRLGKYAALIVIRRIPGWTICSGRRLAEAFYIAVNVKIRLKR